VGVPAANEALQQALPEPISTPLSGVDTSITITQFLRTLDKANTETMRQEIKGLCSAKACSKNAIAQAADDLSNFSFMGTSNISSAFSVANMSHAQYESYVQSIVTEWVKQAGYTVQ
jgi:hypothetical protein